MGDEPQVPGGDAPSLPDALEAPAIPGGPAPGPAAAPDDLGRPVVSEQPDAGSVPASVPAADGTPSWMVGAAPRPPRSGRRRLLGIVGIVALVVVGFLVRFGVGTAVHGIADQLALAGTPMGRLSADDRGAYSARLETALGDRATGLSDAQVGELVSQAERDGLPRLDDASLVDHLGIITSAIDAVDEATCATFARAALAAQAPGDDVSTKLTQAIPDEQVKAWVEISVRAVEASAASSAAPPAPAADASDAAYTALFEALPAADLERVQAVTGDVAAATDTEVCWAIRAVYDGAVALPLEHRAVIARVDISQ